MRCIYLSDIHNAFPKIGPAWDGWDIVLMGDNTNNGSIEEYKMFRQWLDTIKDGRKIFFVRGNHDSGQLGNLPNDRAIKMFDEVKAEYGAKANRVDQGAETYNHASLITLDTVCRTANPYDFAQGEIYKTGYVVRHALWYDIYPHPFTFALHHDPFCSTTTLLFKNAGEFMYEVMQSRLDYVVYGHTHLQPEINYARLYNCDGEKKIGFVQCGAVVLNHDVWIQDKDGFRLVTLQELAA